MEIEYVIWLAALIVELVTAIFRKMRAVKWKSPWSRISDSAHSQAQGTFSADYKEGNNTLWMWKVDLATTCIVPFIDKPSRARNKAYPGLNKVDLTIAKADADYTFRQGTLLRVEIGLTRSQAGALGKRGTSHFRADWQRSRNKLGTKYRLT